MGKIKVAFEMRPVDLMALDEELGKTRREQYQTLGEFAVVSYFAGAVVYALIPVKSTSVEALTQFFIAAITLNATFLVTIAVVFSTLFREVPVNKRDRWVRFFSAAIVVLFLAAVVSAVTLLSLVPAFPASALGVTVAVVLAFGSWFLGTLILLYEIRSFTKR